MGARHQSIKKLSDLQTTLNADAPALLLQINHVLVLEVSTSTPASQEPRASFKPKDHKYLKVI